MFYVLSKLIWSALQPSSLIAITIVAGLALSWLRPGRASGPRLAIAGAGLLLLAGVSPLPNIAILPLEQRFPAPDLRTAAGALKAIIVLGGGEDGRVGRARGQLILNEAGERIASAIGLARRFPQLPILVSAGAAGVLRQEQAGGAAIANFWRDAGIPADRIQVEEVSRTTYENAVVARQLLQPKAGDRFLLVTTAFHMPRSVGAFRHAGFDVVAFPVDYRTAGWTDAGRFMASPANGLGRLDEAAREWVGLLGYRLLGRSTDLFPAP